MQIFEIKNDTAKILYNPKENNLCISDFLFLEDDASTIVSQITEITITEQQNLNVAAVKFLLSVNSDNVLSRYDGHLPARSSDVGYLEPKDIIELFKPKETQLNWGSYLRQPDIDVVTDFNIISSGCCIICDRKEQSSSLINKILPSFKENKKDTLIIDSDGSYRQTDADERFAYGVDYKIPLDSFALDYILENDLDDCPIDAKVVIQGIIMELQNYIEATEDKFLPFDLFLQTITAECKSSQNTGLMVFCNKILKYQQKKIFANKKEEFQRLKTLEGITVFDISEVDTKYQALIYNAVLTNIDKSICITANISEEFITPSMVKSFYDKQNIKPVLIISHKDCLLTKVKSYNKNYIIFSPIEHKHSEEPYSCILKTLTLNDFVIFGESTMFIPLVVILNKEETKTVKEFNEHAVKVDRITEEDLDSLDYARTNIQETPVILGQEAQPIHKDIQNQTASYGENYEEGIRELPEYPDSQENYEEKFQDLPQGQTFAQIDQEKLQEQSLEQNLQDEARKKEQEQKLSDYETKLRELRRQIDEEESGGQTSNKQEFIQVESRAAQQNVLNANTLPIYEPKKNENEARSFEEGDRIRHAKYGIGTIEKIIKYGKKTLYSIQFDTVGRRLLDPKITELVEA